MKITQLGFGPDRIARIAFLSSIALTIAGPSAAQATTSAATTTVNSNSDNFPHLGLLSTAGAQKYASSFQTYAAKFHMVVIGGNFETWERGAGYSKEKVISSIKTQSFVDTRVFQYIDLNSLYNSTYSSLNPFPT